jgi:hypothetical protein
MLLIWGYSQGELFSSTLSGRCPLSAFIDASLADVVVLVLVSCFLSLPNELVFTRALFTVKRPVVNTKFLPTDCFRDRWKLWETFLILSFSFTQTSPAADSVRQLFSGMVSVHIWPSTSAEHFQPECTRSGLGRTRTSTSTTISDV